MRDKKQVCLIAFGGYQGVPAIPPVYAGTGFIHSPVAQALRLLGPAVALPVMKLADKARPCLSR